MDHTTPGDRSLPGWMTKEHHHDDDNDVQSRSQGIYKKNVIEDDLPYLEFGGRVIYSQEKNDCSFLTEDLRSSLMPGSAVGFDLEWPPSFTKGKTKKVALVQLCASEEKCYLFHISSMSGFPPGLKMFLEDESIKKVGVGVEGDKWKLLSDYEIKLKNFVELSDLANEKLRCVEKWSLDGLVKHLFSKRLFKEKDVRCGQWDDFVLTEEQKRYAATDAYAGFIAYQKLERMEVNPGSLKLQECLKQKLGQISRELEDIIRCVPEGLSCTSRAEKLVEDLSQQVASLKDFLTANHNIREERFSNASADHNPKIQSAEISTMNPEPNQTCSKDRNGRFSSRDPVKHPSSLENDDVPTEQREYIMSLDISEYELQMLEMQARQEENEEQSILAFEARSAMDDSAELSYECENDEELDSEMIQCAEKMEKLNDSFEKQPNKAETIADDEDEVVEEDEAEGFDVNLPQPAPEQTKCLKMYFGHHSFKPVQWKVIQSVLEQKRDNLVVMATGYGKSLCFQFPPVFCVNISVVISPLIALMEDQVMQLQMSNIPACFLGSAQTHNLNDDLLTGHFRVVYMTPEFCSGNIPLLQQLNKSVGICLIAVDEAHCISQWGHDFRSAYRDLGKLKRCLPHVPIVALTATASPSIRDDIVKSLHLVNPLVTCTSFDRPNLYLDVNRKSGDVIQDLKSFLVKKKGGDYEFEGSAIIYCPSKKEAERVTSALYKLGIRCGVYHAGLSIKRRKETQYQFMRDEIQCVVATIAFGMGINKPDIRKVIHYGAPKEMESYYQEFGRAGRDGLPSSCHVLWTQSDMALNRFLLSQTRSERFRGYKMEMMAKMEKYLNSTKCRRKLILSHFEDKQLRKVTSGILGTSKCCDNCKSGSVKSQSQDCSEQDFQEFGVYAFQLMGAVKAMGEKFGITAPVLLLRGSTAQRVPERFRQDALFGTGKGMSEAWWRALGRELISEKYLMEASGYNKFSTLCKLTPKGRTWLSKAQDEKHRTLLLQPNRDLCPRVYVPKKQQFSNSVVVGVRDQALPSTSQRTNFRSQVDSSAVIKNDRVAHYRSVPGSPLAPKAMPQPPAVSPREMELQAELYSKLVAERQKLASMKDIPPAILATNKILLDLAKLRPCSVAKLKQVDGVSEAKAAMLAPLLQTITDFCETHSLQEAVTCSSSTSCDEQAHRSQTGKPPAQSLSDSVAITYRLFQSDCKSMRQVADARSLPMAVVESHLLQAQKAGQPLDTERAGLSLSLFNTVTHILSSPPLSSDLSDFKNIRAVVPEDISTFLLKLCVAKLQDEGFPKPQPVNLPSKQHHITWIEPQEKLDQADGAGKAVTSELRTHQLEPELDNMDNMDMSDDELFSELPMPEDVGTTRSVAQCEVQDGRPSKSSGIELASWNQENLDRDTQDLFSDSPVKAESQAPKRKMPDWAEAPTDSQNAAASKKNKKKKGLFM
ncbi:bifunctional 3'-5' exonuclease/ATP-dependent helicase WRN isoform 2-T2 [Clarias gariepinus]|uniref:bifunctional 3'-5' exonuclease/ATP-dependent helicase WRN isoform X2 n=1 Tax=Clarias gariepinus TaxID=13013 RepID=UPI00234C4EE1|nr:bifunctional 3'-5' exonuclease/ATP-dependent helicase WRN isoform X2 [Clarias gariepinus]